MSSEKTDPVVEAVRADLHRRSQLGISKYGSTLAENHGDERYWLNHAYEEALDLANYLKRRIMEIDGELVHLRQQCMCAACVMRRAYNIG